MTKDTLKEAPADEHADTTVDSADSASSDSSATSDSVSPQLVEVPEVGTTDPPAPTNSGFVSSETTTFLDVQKADTEALAHLGEPEDKEVSFSYLSHNDPNRQRDPYGTYTDDIERAKAEVLRARAEGREPDLDNPPPTAGTPYIPTVAAQLQAAPGVISPVAGTEVLSVGVAEADVTKDAEAAAQQGKNPDGSPKE